MRKHVVSLARDVAKGDASGLQKDLGTVAKKIGTYSTKALGAATRAATGGGELVDMELKDLHEKISHKLSLYVELMGLLKHQVERARKTAKTLRDSGTCMQSLADAISQGPRHELRTANAVEAALSRSWDEYARQLEGAVLAPGKHELGVLFAEAETLYSSYLSIVNELSARQGKERLLGNASANVSTLMERKSADERAKLPRLQVPCHDQTHHRSRGPLSRPWSLCAHCLAGPRRRWNPPWARYGPLAHQPWARCDPYHPGYHRER